MGDRRVWNTSEIHTGYRSRNTWDSTRCGPRLNVLDVRKDRSSECRRIFSEFISVSQLFLCGFVAAVCESGQTGRDAEKDQPVHHGNGVESVYGHGTRALKAVHAPDFTKRKREPDRGSRCGRWRM